MSDRFGIVDVLVIGGIIAVGFLSGPLAAATLAYLYLTAKFPRDGTLEQGQTGIQVNVTSNEASMPVIYGEARVGMKLIDVQQQSGGEGKVLALVGAFALGGEDGGGIESVQKVYFDEVLAIDGPTATGAATNNTNIQGPWKEGTSFGDDLWVQYGLHLGANGQTHDTELATRFSNWGVTDDGRGIAYLALLLFYNEEVWTTGWPRVTMLVRGAKLFDMRDSSTAYSDNPALAIYDFMKSTKYGMGIPTSKLNTASFSAAANACDVLVSTPSGDQKRFTVGGWLDPAANPQRNLARLLSGCRGEIVLIGDEYHLQIRLVQAAESYELDTENIVGDFEFWRGGINEVPNLITATFIDPDLNYQPNDISWPEAGEANPYLDADNDFVNSQLIELPFTDDLYRAEQITQIVLQEARRDLGVALTADRSSLVLQRGDVVKITHPTPGWSSKEFWVIAIGVQTDGNVRIIGREYDADAYSLSTVATKDAAPGTNLPDPSSVLAPTNLVLTADGSTSQVLQDGTRVPRILVGWTASVDPFLASYDVRRKVTAEADSTFQIVATPGQGDTQVYLSDVANGVEYTVELLARSITDVVSSSLTDTVTVATTEAPAAGGINITLNGATIQLTWGSGTATGARYFAKATEPTLADVQGGTATTDSPVTVYTFSSGAELRWIGVLLYTNGITATENESQLVTVPIQFTGAATTLTEGDIQYANATPVLTSLAIEGAGTFLRSNGTIPQWSTATLPDTAVAGDVLYASATNVWSSLGKGSAGEVLTMNAGATAPEWAAGGGLDPAAAETITGGWTFDTSGTLFGATITTQHIIPAAANTYDLGATGNVYSKLWVNNLEASGVGAFVGDWRFTTGTCAFATAASLEDNALLRFGNSADYWMNYWASNTAFEFWTSDADGIGGNAIIWSVQDGTKDVLFTGAVGFNNTAPIAKPTITGAKDGNAALASVCTIINNLGLATDSST